MAKGVSIHIGVGRLSSHYLNTGFGDMLSAIQDANDMLDILPNTFEKDLLPNATTRQVRESISNYAVGNNKLSPGDLLVITYAGHGGFIPVKDSFENDGRNETWCLHDKQLLDDELLEEWTKFDEGVRILVISDSCHSGTIIDKRLIETAEFSESEKNEVKKRSSENINTDFSKFEQSNALDSAVRTLPRELLKAIYAAKNNNNDYIQRQKIVRENLEEKLEENVSNGFNGLVRASILLLSACQDDQLAKLSPDKRNGLFTKHLIEEWDGGNFTGNYLQFHQGIWKKIKHKQSPNYYKIGTPIPEFDLQKPFTI